MSRGQTEPARAALMAALDDEAGRKASTATILYQLAIADRLGLALTDLVSREILSRTGAITAGELAELSGLTTGAITGVVDRLEKAGLVRRVNDPNDRRRVMLELESERFEQLSGEMYAALQERFNRLCADYEDEELALLVEFLRKHNAVLDEETGRLREESARLGENVTRAHPPSTKPHREPNPGARMTAHARTQGEMHENMRRGTDAEALIHVRKGGPKETRVFSAHRGEIALARLKWVSGSVKLYLRGTPEMTELYRAEFKHDIPIVRDNDGNVSVQYRHRTLFGRGGGEAQVDLNRSTAWAIYFECGASHIEADLRELALKSFWLKSKASKLELQLPPPVGTVEIHMESPLSGLHVMRPKGVPARLEFEGDWASLRFDRHKKSVGTQVYESPDFKAATDRYVIEFVAGGSKIVVE